jgi:hypothetical protein
VGATVLTATLSLYQVSASGALNYEIVPWGAVECWGETTVNWNNQPVSDPFGDLASSLDTTSGWKTWDVSNVASLWPAGQISNFGIVLLGDSRNVGERVFASSEDIARSPTLSIEYSLPNSCVEVLSPASIPMINPITFDDLPNGTVIGNSYQSSRGVSFENSGVTRALILTGEPITETRSFPNVAINSAVPPNTSNNVPMRISFATTKTHVGFWMGNGEGASPRAVLTAYALDGTQICTVVNAPVPEAHSEFIGVFDSYGRIASVALDYGATLLSESIDDLYYSPFNGESTLPVISNIQPTEWVTTTQAPTVYASAIDTGSGLNVTSAEYRFSTNGGEPWSAWQPAAISGSIGATTQQTITATNVLFNADSAANNLIEFRVADMMGNVGVAQGIIKIDTTPPSAPTSLVSGSHSLAVWSNDNTVAISWSGASDATSGLHSYFVRFVRSPSGPLPTPSTNSFITSATSPVLADAADWYAQVRARDWAGHWSVFVITIGPFQIDTTPPTLPGSVASLSHLPSTWSIDPTITMDWSAATDALSGVNGYAYLFNTTPDTPPSVINVFGTTVTSSPLASGSGHYFHLRVRDAAGNWSPTAVHRGPYRIDVTPPFSSVSSPATVGSSSFVVSWSGTDAHSGVASYDVQYRNVTTGGPWTDWRMATALTSAAFAGSNGNIYQFRSRARDNVGNLEPYPSVYDSQTGVANVDVWARSPGLEVNQAVQDLSNSVTLIAGKRTFVRAYVGSDAGNIGSVPARLQVYRGGTYMGTVLPSNAGGSITVRSNPNRDALNDAYYFDVPTAWLSAGSVTFNFQINTPQKYAENDHVNNTSSVTVNFVNSPVMNLDIVDVPYRFGGVVRNIRTVDRTLLESWIRRAFPVKTLNVYWSYLDPPYGSLPSAGTVNGDLVWNKIKAILDNGEDLWMRYYGMAINTGGFMRGLAVGIPSTVASGPTGPAGGWDTDASFGDWYGGHELGHTYGQRHVRGAPYAGKGDCGDEDGANGSYPYAGGDISPVGSGWASNAKYGFDNAGPTIIPPTWKDVMTYCDNEWVSDYTYERIYNRMVAEKPVAAAAIQQMKAAGVEHLAVIGSITIPTDTVSLSAFYRVPDSFDMLERDVNGEYHIRLLGDGDAPLADYPFSPRFSDSSDQPLGIISEMVPWDARTRKVVIAHSATVLATRDVSANAPTVAITSPNGGVLGGNNVIVTWNASDADGNALVYSLDFSADGGTTWEPISGAITQPQISIELARLPGTTQGRFRVWATDGVNSATDVSDGNLTISGKAPTIVSIAPTTGQTYVISQTVTFEGQAHDVEDGMLADGQLEWSSNLQGLIGTGTLLQSADLALGTHVITLKATDSNGSTTQATTTVTIGAEEHVEAPPIYQVFLPTLTRQ